MTFEFRDDLEDLYDSMPAEHRRVWRRYTDHLYVEGVRDWPAFMPDVVIAPDGTPYLYRWYVFPLDRAVVEPQTMFHIQVASDPERPLHDHPWDNTSTILIGAYDEIIDPDPENQTSEGFFKRYSDKSSLTQFTARRTEGQQIQRLATTAHRLILPRDVPYTMTLFQTGPKVREWGFWYPDGFHHNEEHVAWREGVSVHVNRGDTG